MIVLDLSRAAQLRRLAAWRKPDWADHFARVDALLAEVAAMKRLG